jgi:hypothetical protein
MGDLHHRPDPPPAPDRAAPGPPDRAATDRAAPRPSDRGPSDRAVTGSPEGGSRQAERPARNDGPYPAPVTERRERTAHPESRNPEADRFEARLADRAARRGRPAEIRVPAPVTGLRPHADGPGGADTDAGRAARRGDTGRTVARLDAQREKDRPAFTEPAEPDSDGPQQGPDAAGTRIAELKARHQADQSVIADLTAKVDSVTAEFGGKLDAARAEVADVTSRMDDMKAEHDTKIADLNSEVAELKQLFATLNHADHRDQPAPAERNRPEADGERTLDSGREVPGVDTSSQRADRPHEQTRDQGRADAPILDAEAREKRADAPKAVRRGPSDAALGFMISGAGTALGEVATILPPAAHAATLTAGVLGMLGSGVAWLRQRRKAKDADRSPS